MFIADFNDALPAPELQKEKAPQGEGGAFKPPGER
jgi:hypothetical protein